MDTKATDSQFQKGRRAWYLTLDFKTSFFKASVAATALWVSLGWVDSDSRNVFSCMFGLKGSVGHVLATASRRREREDMMTIWLC